MDQHNLIAALKDLAMELGRTPTRNEFRVRVRGGDKVIAAAFGSYATLVQASGLDPVSLNRRKLTNQIFERDVEVVLQEYEPRRLAERTVVRPTLVLGDTHFPFITAETLDWVYEMTRKLQPERIVQIGDLYDLYAFSRFPRSQNQYRPEEEVRLARDGAAKMWKTLQGIAPKAECVQLLGNHDTRPIKQAMAAMPEFEHIVSKWLKEIMSFDGVLTIDDPRQEFIADGVIFHHGYRTGLGAHRDYNLQNTACGHTHKGGVVFRRFRDQVCWELNAGLLGDPESKALSYTPQKAHDCTIGLGWIDSLGPRFIPR